MFLRELLVSTPPGADTAQAQKKAKDLADRGKKGEKFDDLARNNSDSASAQQDGDIGAYEKGKLRPEIEKTVWDQPRGYVTDPINVGNGFLILKVEEHQKAGLASFEEVLTADHQPIVQSAFQPGTAPLSHPASRDGLPRNQTGLRRQWSRTRQEYRLGGPGRDQTRNHHQGTGSGPAAPSPLTWPGAHSWNEHAEYRHLFVALSSRGALPAKNNENPLCFGAGTQSAHPGRVSRPAQRNSPEEDRRALPVADLWRTAPATSTRKCGTTCRR